MSATWLVVRREIREKLRSKAFLILNGVLLLVVLAATVLPTVLAGDGPDATRIGSVGPDAATVVAAAAAQAEAAGVRVELVEVADEATARTLVDGDELDLALVGTDRAIADGDPNPQVLSLVEGARRVVLLDGALTEAGIDAEQRAALLSPPPLEVVAADPVDQPAGEGPSGAAIGLALGAGGILYGLLIFYGQQVAQGVVQEKQSRVIEVLLATLRPIELLGGKLLGLGLLGLGQVAALGAVAYLGLLLTDRAAVPPETVPTVVATVLWFVLGYGFYATLFALAAAVVAKTEDLQTAMTVPILVLIGSFFLSQLGFAEPDSTFATVAMLLPSSAPIYQPLGVALGATSPLLTVLGVVSVVATTAVLVPVTARVHAGASLSVRQRISIREALRRNRA